MITDKDGLPQFVIWVTNGQKGVALKVQCPFCEKKIASYQSETIAAFISRHAEECKPQ